jgi:hypothetical protein
MVRRQLKEPVMRKFLISIAIITSSVAAVPASAQMWRLQPSVQREIRSDINQLNSRINRAAQRGTISRREAMGLRRDALQLQRDYNRSVRNGLSRAEVARLETGVNRIQLRLRLERRDWDGRRG